MSGSEVIQPASVEYIREDAHSQLAGELLQRYFDELHTRFPQGFVVERTVTAPIEELKAPHGCFVVARLDGRPVGCGAVRKLDESTGEIKRMWTDPTVRGQSVGKGLLEALENIARTLGCRRVLLDTGEHLTEAIALYRSSGYQEIDAYNDNPYATFWFEKSLTTV